MTDPRFPLDGRLPDMLRSGKPLRAKFLVFYVQRGNKR